MSQDTNELTCRVKLEKNMADSPSEQLAEYLLLSNITKFKLKNSTLRLTYNVTEIRWSEIEANLEELNLNMDKFWLNRFRRKWYSFVDENAYSNAIAKNPHCCNKPPVVPTKR